MDDDHVRISNPYQGQLRNGRLPPDYGLSTEASATVILPGGPADLDLVQLIVTEENRMQRSFGVAELLILAHVWRERTIDTPTAAELTQRDDSYARSVLENLVETGLLERRGDRKGRTYLLSAGVYREIGHPEAYVRARGFELLQMEQMIFQFVQAHGQITRREVVELCRLSKNQAGYLLKKLTGRGDLRLMGSGRGAHYKLGKTRKKLERRTGHDPTFDRIHPPAGTFDASAGEKNIRPVIHRTVTSGGFWDTPILSNSVK